MSVTSSGILASRRPLTGSLPGPEPSSSGSTETSRGGSTSLVTCGLSGLPGHATLDHKLDQELMLSLTNSPYNDEALESFAAMVNIVATEGHGLARGQLVELSRPLVPVSVMRWVLVDIPHYFDEKLWYFPSRADDGYGQRTQVLWLVPLHDGEAALVREFGYDALSHRFGDAESLDVTDLSRASLVG